MTTPVPALDLNDIQGDILPGIPKKTQTYLFFNIADDVVLFRKQLVDIVPLIKTAAQVQSHRNDIADYKKKQQGGLLTITGTTIAFSHTGLVKMGIHDLDSDTVFANGQKADAEALGDKGTGTGATFVPDWDPAFLNPIDAVIFVAGDSHNSVDKELENITRILGPSIKVVKSIRGDVRPGKEKGHEHFGFLDGISNPAVEGFDKPPFNGPEPVPQDVILTGKDAGAPAVLNNGSVLAFRYLFQLVPEFNKFLKDNPINLPGLTREEGSEFLGARMVGRWKSGAPLDLAPLRDDPVLGSDPRRNNFFSYDNELLNGDQTRCPYSAHLRKTNPRDDLEGPTNNTSVKPNRIIRRGVQFGPEVTDEEARESQTKHGRGLLFVAYQSQVQNGFALLQKKWANNSNFVINAKDFQGNVVKPGFDPIIGQNGDAVRTTVGVNPQDADGSLTLPTTWVVPRGGEYFFVPSITALRDTMATGVEIE